MTHYFTMAFANIKCMGFEKPVYERRLGNRVPMKENATYCRTMHSGKVCFTSAFDPICEDTVLMTETFYKMIDAGTHHIFTGVESDFFSGQQVPEPMAEGVIYDEEEFGNKFAVKYVL